MSGEHNPIGDMPMPMPPMPPDSMHNGSAYMNDMVMHMSFFWGKDVTVLFEGWPNGRPGMYILALLFVFFLSFAVEILPVFTSSSISRLKGPMLGGMVYTVGYAVKMALAYMVMLSVMSFNLGIFIVAVLGHAVGGFVVKYRSPAKGTAAHSDEPWPPSTNPLP